MDTQRFVEFITKNWFWCSAWFLITILLIQDMYDLLTRKHKTVTPAKAVALLNDENTVVIDVREPHEFAKGHIENARLISIGKIDEKLYELEPHKDKPILVICQQGTRSAHACKKLNKAGFSQVYELSGGMLAWEDQKLPISKKK